MTSTLLLLSIVSEKSGNREGLKMKFKSSGLDILCVWRAIYKRSLFQNQSSFQFSLDYAE